MATHKYEKIDELFEGIGTPPTPEEFKDIMETISQKYQGRDAEAVHGDMDKALCTLLKMLGYSEAVEIFKNEQKWYG